MKTYIAMLKFMHKDESLSHHLTVRVQATDVDHALASIAGHDFSDRDWFMKSMRRMVVQIDTVEDIYRIEALEKEAPRRRRRARTGAAPRRRRRRVPA